MEAVTVPAVAGLSVTEANAVITAASLTPDLDPIISGWYTFADALERVQRSRGRTLYVNVEHAAKYTEREGFYCAMSPVEVTKPAAVRFLNSSIGQHYRDRVQVHLAFSKRCMFIGTGSFNV